MRDAAAVPAGHGRRAWLALGLALVVAAALYGYGARGFALADPDEGRYAEIAREVVASGDWLVPRLNYVLYFEKPPLVYWATALAFVGFGEHEAAARLPSVLAALLALLCSAWLAARLYGPGTALLAVAVLAVSPLFGILAVVLTLDMALTAAMTAALCAAWQAIAAGGSRRWIRVTFALTAGSVLVKGPVSGLLVGAIVLAFVLLHGGPRALRAWLDWRAWALAAAIVAPWFVLVGWRHPEFWHFFVVDQHLTRYTSKREHGQPIWYFLPLLPVALAPWGVLALLDPGALRARWDPRAWAPGTRFLALWAGIVVAFFSLSAGKLLTYILPAMPPLAILCARLVERTLAEGRRAGLVRTGWLLLVAGLVTSACAAILPLLLAHWRVRAVAPFLFAAALPMTLAGLLVARLAARGRLIAAVGALAAGWALIFAVALSGRGVANEYRALALAARAELRPDDRLVAYRKYVQGLPFYTGRRVIFVGGGSELKFGSQQGDQSAWFWPHDTDLLREWQRPGRLVVLLNRTDLDRLRPQLEPAPIELATKDKKVLIVNRR